MIDLQRKLYKFWSSFTYEGKPIPAYVEDAVPEEASFPYFAFQVQEGDTFGKSTMICTLCCQAENGSNVNLQRAAILDEVRRAMALSRCTATIATFSASKWTRRSRASAMDGFTTK